MMVSKSGAGRAHGHDERRNALRPAFNIRLRSATHFDTEFAICTNVLIWTIVFWICKSLELKCCTALPCRALGYLQMTITGTPAELAHPCMCRLKSNNMLEVHVSAAIWNESNPCHRRHLQRLLECLEQYGPPSARKSSLTCGCGW